jgi:sigma-B regulation protein RsbU (phosphoserine phosphatase)
MAPDNKPQFRREGVGTSAAPMDSSAGGPQTAATTRVLIADDEPDLELLVRQRFRKQIREGRYEFVFVPNGCRALDAIQSAPRFEVLLTDINMPEMDGLTLLSRVVEQDASLLPVVVSAYGDMPNIRAAMNLGAFDFLTKPIDFSDFETTLERTVRQALQARQAEHVRKELSTLQSELNVATRIQRSLLPAPLQAVPGVSRFEVEAAMHPARNVGGDFYDYFPVGEGRFGFAIGDVSGKGVPAAIFMAMCRALLKSIALRGLDPGACLGELNRSLCRDNTTEMFVTLFYGVLDTATGELWYASGGHNPPYVLGRGGRVTPLDRPQSTVLGLIDDVAPETYTAALEPSDVVVAFTDGVTEAMTRERCQFGTPRLEEYLRGAAARSAGDLVRGLVERVRSFTAGAAQSDDITVLVVRFGPV